MQQFTAQMMAFQQKSQTIIMESCEDKPHEAEAKFNNNMLQLLLIRSIIDFSSPGYFIYSGNEEHSTSAHFGQINLNGQNSQQCFHQNLQGHGQEA